MRLAQGLLVISCMLAIAACPGGGDGNGWDGGTAGYYAAGAGGAAAAAGASGGSGSGNVSTGLPSSKRLSELTAPEAQTLCIRLAQAGRDALSQNDFQRFTCTIEALGTSIQQDASGMTSIDRMACQAAVNSCLAEEGDTTTENNCAQADLAADLMGCTATASELEACLSASIGQLRNLLTTFDCDSTVSELMNSDGFEEPAACESLDMKCPGVLDAIGDSTEVLPDMGMSSSGTGGAGGAGGFGGSAGSAGGEGPGGCSDTCRDAMDGWCDDGGEDSMSDICALGTDCTDCGTRP